MDSTGPAADRGHGLYITSIAMVAVAGLCVGIRLLYRGCTKKQGWDDYAIGTSLAMSFVYTAAICSSIHYGYGHHKDLIPPEKLSMAFKWYYICQIVYKVEVCLTKSSILLSYLRIFQATVMRRLCYLFLASILIWTVASILAAILQCLPIKDALALSDQGRCISRNSFWLAYGIINVVTDVLILLLPVWTIARLQMPKRDRVGLLLTLFLAGFVVLTGIIRVTAVKASEDNVRDATWAFVPRTTWTVIEANTGIICACLPALRKPLFALWFPHQKVQSYGTDFYSGAKALRSDSDAQPLSRYSAMSDWDMKSSEEMITPLDAAVLPSERMGDLNEDAKDDARQSGFGYRLSCYFLAPLITKA